VIPCEVVIDGLAAFPDLGDRESYNQFLWFITFDTSRVQNGRAHCSTGHPKDPLFMEFIIVYKT
jgi:hypothetical protein